MRKFYLDVFQGIPYPHLLPLAKEAGFDGFFSDWTYADDLARMTALHRQGQELGLTYANCHSTIPLTDLLWSDVPQAEEAVAQLFRNIDNCQTLGVPAMVVHVSPICDPDFNRGIKRMERVVEYAHQRDVLIAFENTHDEAYIVQTIRHFDGCDWVGFCYDSGHEAFVTPGARLLPQIGDRLVCTHLNDNYLDGDHHLIPGDGKIDVDRMLGELRDIGYQGSLTLEVNYDRYRDQLTPLEFTKRCFDTLMRFDQILA